MNTLKSLLAAAVALSMASAAHAGPTSTGTQAGVRQFVFDDTEINAGDHEDADFQGGAQIVATSTTNVDVEPYILVRGSFGGNWKLNGWDANKSAIDAASSIEVFHNAPFTERWAGFGNPVGPGGHELPMTIRESYEIANGATGSQAEVPAANLNVMFGDDYNTPAITQGYVKWTLHQFLTAPTNSPAGTYSITPSITFTSMAD